MSQHVVVVGAGIIGTACAHYLQQAGWQVTVIDKGKPGEGCSHGNCGFVCPSHVLPLTTPEALAKGFRSLFSRNSALSIPWRYDPTLWKWLWNFSRRCNRKNMIESAHGIAALLKLSRDLYDDLLTKESIDCEWQTRGLLFVFQSRAAMDHYAETDTLLRETFSMPARRFDGDEVSQLEPALKPGLAGGWLYESDAHLRPDKLMSSWQTLLRDRGVEFHFECELRTIVRNDTHATSVSTNNGDITTDAVVIATGAMTPLLKDELGCRIPIQPGKGYSLTMPRPTPCPSYPLIFEEHSVAITPWQSGYRIGSTMEFTGYDSSLSPKRLQFLRDGASHYLLQSECEPILETWYGWRPMTYDSLPIIDFSPKYSNVLIVAGHNMLGLSMGPVTGLLAAEMLGRKKTSLDVGPYSLQRFR